MVVQFWEVMLLRPVPPSIGPGHAHSNRHFKSTFHHFKYRIHYFKYRIHRLLWKRLPGGVGGPGSGVVPSFSKTIGVFQHKIITKASQNHRKIITKSSQNHHKIIRGKSPDYVHDSTENAQKIRHYVAIRYHFWLQTARRPAKFIILNTKSSF